MLILTESLNIGNKSDESSIRKGNFSKRKPSYNARSDTVLEMCDSEDISFIDEDPCDIIVDDNQEDSDNSNNMQQIVIKSNNEIELTSNIVNTHNQSRGKRLNPDFSKNPSLQDHKEQDYFQKEVLEPTTKFSWSSFGIT
jgi:hypothetical protein